MDHLPQERQTQLIASLDAGRLPRLLRSHRYVLDLANGRNAPRAILVDANGPTADGEFVYNLLGMDVPTELRFDMLVQPTQRGPNEWAKTVDGKEVRLRTLSAEGTKWHYTAAGRQFYAQPRSQCVIQIPVTIHGTNSGTPYNRGEDFLPVHERWPALEAILLDQHLTDAQKKVRIKEEVKRRKGITDTPIVIEVESDEEFRYDPTREHAWRIHIMTTVPSAHGPSVSVALRQPMGAFHNTATVPYPQQVLDVCFEKHDDKLCVPRALAQLLSMPMDLIAESFDYTTESRRWRTHGITSEQLMKWCVLENRNAYCILRGPKSWVVQSQKCEGRSERGVAWCTVDNHCYVYKDAHILAALAKGEGFLEERYAPVFNLQVDVEPRVQGEYFKEDNKNPDVRSWRPWEGVIEPGFFYAKDLHLVRNELCQMGRLHKVSKGEKDYTMISLQCVEALDGVKGTCTIKYLHKEVDKILAWLQRIEALTGITIIWQGEGLPNLTLQVFQRLMRATRQNLSLQEKIAIRQAQDNKCALCKEAEIQEFDHIVPVRASFRGQSQELQGLCFACHNKCTSFQSDRLRIQSQLSPFACRAYRDTVRAPNLAFISHAAQGDYKEAERNGDEPPKGCHWAIIDIRRCRFSACSHYDLPSFPCFCPFDNIEPFDITNPKLGDLNFIDPPPVHKSQTSILKELPLVGPMWYGELEARHALSHGLIQWSDVKAIFKATGRIPRESVETVLSLMEAAWPRDDNGDMDPLAKSSWNSAQGLMATEFLTRYRVITTETMLPSLGTFQESHAFVVEGEEKLIIDHITELPLVSCCTYRPFWDCVMSWEHVKCAVIAYAVEHMYQIPHRSILQLQTDSLLVSNLKRRGREVEEIASMTYEQACRVSNDPSVDRHLKRARGVSYPVRQGDNGLIFQQKKGKKLPGDNYDKVRRRAELLTLSKIWREIPTVVNGRLNVDAVLRHVLNGGHIWIDGMGGAGKTTLAREIVKQLRAMGKRVQIIAKTNSAVQNFGGDGVQTASKWLYWHVSKGNGDLPDVLFIEEISMIDTQLWGYISTLFQAGNRHKVQIVLAGDLFQLSPPKNTWNGNDVPKHALRDSDLLYELAGGNRCFLDTNQRSDEIIFAFAKSLRQPGADLKERLAAAKEMFKMKLPARIPDHILVMSHAKRMRYCEQLNNLKKPQGAMKVEKPATLNCRDECQLQSMYVWPGMKIMGQKTVKDVCVKSQMYEVVSCDDKAINIRSNGVISVVPTSRACELLRLTDALTYQRAQGLTLSGLVVLADTTNAHFELEHLNMGVTRATHSDLVEIRDL